MAMNPVKYSEQELMYVQMGMAEHARKNPKEPPLLTEGHLQDCLDGTLIDDKKIYWAAKMFARGKQIYNTQMKAAQAHLAKPATNLSALQMAQQAIKEGVTPNVQLCVNSVHLVMQALLRHGILTQEQLDETNAELKKEAAEETAKKQEELKNEINIHGSGKVPDRAAIIRIPSPS